jgi:hypothetical protein
MALQIAKKSVRRPTHSLKPTGLPPDRVAQPVDELEQAHGAVEGRVRGRRHHGLARLDACGCGRFRLRDLDARQHAAVTGLGSLGELYLDHPDVADGWPMR